MTAGAVGYRRVLFELDKAGVTDLFESIPTDGDRFYVAEKMLSLGKVDCRYVNLLRMLFLGESLRREELQSFNHLMDALKEVNILATNDGMAGLNGLVLNRYRGVWFLTDCPLPSPKRYFGPDSLGLARRIVPQPGKRALDLCAGTGVQSLILASGGMHVTSVEIDGDAFSTNVVNINLNGLNCSITAKQGDLFECLSQNEQFDYIVANPPLVPVPCGLEYPFVGNGGQDGCDVLNRIIEGLPDYLSENGTALIIGMIAWDGRGSLESTSVVKTVNGAGLLGTMTLLGFDEVYPNSPIVEGVAWSAYLSSPESWTTIDAAMDNVYKLYRSDRTVGVYYFLLRLRKGGGGRGTISVIDHANRRSCTGAWMI